jgi:hypothetical protein
MPVFYLTDEHIFPPPHLAEKEGLLAVGGDLSEDRLLLAYHMGIQTKNLYCGGRLTHDWCFIRKKSRSQKL